MSYNLNNERIRVFLRSIASNAVEAQHALDTDVADFFDLLSGIRSDLEQVSMLSTVLIEE